MAFKLAELYAELSGDETKLVSALSRARKGVDSLKAGLEKASSYAKYALGGMATVAGISVKAFSEQEQADKKLEASLIAAGIAADVYLTKFTNLAGELQKVTSFSDDQIEGLMAQEAQFGIAAGKIEEYTRQVIGLAGALGVDLDSAFKLTIQAENGNFTMLQKTMPILKRATTDVEKMAMVREMAARGLAREAALQQTDTGMLNQNIKALMEQAEVLGKMLLPYIVDASKWVVKHVEALSKWIQANKETATSYAKTVIAGGTFLAIAPSIISTSSSMISVIKGLSGALEYLGISGLTVCPPLAVIAAAVAVGTKIWSNYRAEVNKANADMKELATGLKGQEGINVKIKTAMTPQDGKADENLERTRQAMRAIEDELKRISELGEDQQYEYSAWISYARKMHMELQGLEDAQKRIVEGERQAAAAKEQQARVEQMRKDFTKSMLTAFGTENEKRKAAIEEEYIKLKDTLAKMQLSREEYAAKLDALDKGRQAKLDAMAKEEADKQRDKNQTIADAYQQMSIELLGMTKGQRARDIAELDADYKKKKEMFAGNAEQLLELEKWRKAKLADIDKANAKDKQDTPTFTAMADINKQMQEAIFKKFGEDNSGKVAEDQLKEQQDTNKWLEKVHEAVAKASAVKKQGDFGFRDPTAGRPDTGGFKIV